MSDGGAKGREQQGKRVRFCREVAAPGPGNSGTLSSEGADTLVVCPAEPAAAVGEAQGPQRPVETMEQAPGPSGPGAAWSQWAPEPFVEPTSGAEAGCPNSGPGPDPAMASGVHPRHPGPAINSNNAARGAHILVDMEVGLDLRLFITGIGKKMATWEYPIPLWSIIQ